MNCIWKDIKNKGNVTFNVFTNFANDFGQKVGDKFTKLSKAGFSKECFTADCVQFFTKNCQNLAFGSEAGSSPLDPNISGIF